MGDVAVHIMSDLPPQLDLPPALPGGHSDDSSSSGSSVGSPASLPPAIPPALPESISMLPVPLNTAEESSYDVDESVKNDENEKSGEADVQSPNLENTPHEYSTPSGSVLPTFPSSSTSASGVESDLDEKSTLAAGGLAVGDIASNSSINLSSCAESSEKTPTSEIASLESSEPENSLNFPKPAESAVAGALAGVTASQDVQQAVSVAENESIAGSVVVEGQEGQDTVSQPTEVSGDVQEGAGSAAPALEGESAADSAIVVEDPTPPPNPLDLLAISTAPRLSHVTASRAKGPAGGRRPPTRGVVVESKPQSEPDKPMDTSRLAEIAFSSPIEPVSDDVAVPSPEGTRKQKHISLGQPMMKFDVTAVKLKPSTSNPAVQSQEAPEVAPATDFRSMLRARSSSNSDLQKGIVTKKPASALPASLVGTPPPLQHASSTSSLGRPASLPPLIPDALPAPIPGELPPALPSSDLPSSDLPAPMQLPPSALPPLTPDSQKKKGAKPAKLEKSSSHKEVEKAQKDAEKAQKKAQKEAKAKEAKEAKDSKKKRHTFSPTSSAAIGPAIQASATAQDAPAPADLPAPLAALPPAPKGDTASKKGIASFLTGFFKSRPKRELLVEKGLLAPEELPTQPGSAVASSSAPPPLSAAPPPPLAAAPPPPLSNAPPALASPPAALPAPTTPSMNSKKAKLESKASKRISLPAAIPATVPPPLPSAAPPPLQAAVPPPLPSSKPPAPPGAAPPPLPSAAPPPLPASVPSALPPPIPGGTPPQAKLPSLPPPMSAPPKGPPPSALPPPLPSGPPPSLPPVLPPPGRPTN